MAQCCGGRANFPRTLSGEQPQIGNARLMPGGRAVRLLVEWTVVPESASLPGTRTDVRASQKLVAGGVHRLVEYMHLLDGPKCRV
jgi:hypothetical protein